MWLRRWGWALKPALGSLTLVVFALLFGTPPTRSSDARPALRLGYFPNITHAPALVGVADGLFQRALDTQARLETAVFNSGPEALEALIAGSLDAAYVGPGPAVQFFVKTQGRGLAIVAGACNGGAALVARKNSGIATLRELDGRRVAVPQLGGTQDIALRRFLLANNLKPRENGGTVEVLPIKNPDVAGLFKRGQLDAAWVPEPWVSRLMAETEAQLVVDERDLWPEGRFTTTVLVVRRDLLTRYPERVQALLRGHVAALRRLEQSPQEAQAEVNAELKRLTGKALPEPVFQAAWERVRFAAEPDADSVREMALAAQQAGYLPKQAPDLSQLFETRLLQTVLQEKL